MIVICSVPYTKSITPFVPREACLVPSFRGEGLGLHQLPPEQSSGPINHP
nr:MAG TPA: hypothetical protein [Caudoviricetes sp.]